MRCRQTQRFSGLLHHRGHKWCSPGPTVSWNQKAEVCLVYQQHMDTVAIGISLVSTGLNRHPEARTRDKVMGLLPFPLSIAEGSEVQVPSHRPAFPKGGIEVAPWPGVVPIDFMRPLPWCWQHKMVSPSLRQGTWPVIRGGMLSEPEGELLPKDSLGTGLGCMACSSRCYLRRRSHTIWVRFLNE